MLVRIKNENLATGGLNVLVGVNKNNVTYPLIHVNPSISCLAKIHSSQKPHLLTTILNNVSDVTNV